jgi:hypothetical protein
VASKNVFDVVCGPPQKFKAPDWPTFLEKRWTRFLAEQMRIGTTHEEAFRAGWHACMDELGQTSREGERP